MISLSDRAGFLIVANLIKYAVGFVMPMVLVRMLSQSDYGTYQQLILIGTVTGSIMALGLPSSVFYFYHHVPPERRATLVVQTSLMLGVSGVIASAAIFFGAAPIAESFNNASMTGLLRIYALSIAFMIASEQCISFMISQDRYPLAVGLEVGETVVRVLILLAPLWLGYGLPGVVAGILCYAALRFAVRIAYLFGTGGMQFGGWSKSLFPREQLGYSTPLALVALISLTATAFNKGIVAASFTPAEFAIYAVGALEIPLDVIFQGSVFNVLRASLPPLVRDGNLQETVRIVREAVRKLSIVVLPSFVFLLGYSHDFITLLFTSQYEESVQVFRIYLWLMPLYMFVLSPIPQIFGRTKVNLHVNLAVTAVLVIFSYVFLKTIGLYGPALAMVLSQYLGSGLFFVVVVRLTRSTLRNFLPWSALLRVTLASLLGFVAARLTDGLIPVGLLNLMLAGAVFSAVFLASGAVIGLFTRADRELIRRWLAKILPIRAG